MNFQIEIVFNSGKELVINLTRADYNKLTTAYQNKGGVIQVIDYIYSKEFFINVQAIAYIGEV